MAKIDRLVGDVLLAQDKLTTASDNQQVCRGEIDALQEKRNNAVAIVLKLVTELERERDELKKQLSDLTPHPDDDAHYAEYDNHSRGW